MTDRLKWKSFRINKVGECGKLGMRKNQHSNVSLIFKVILMAPVINCVFKAEWTPLYLPSISAHPSPKPLFKVYLSGIHSPTYFQILSIL